MITLPESRLREMLVEAAQIGAQRAIDDMAFYQQKEVCRKLKISQNTLRKRILEGKIKTIDGSISGAELRKYMGLVSNT